MNDSLNRLVELGSRRLAELKELSDKMFVHVPAADLATILFPPALGLDLLNGAVSDELSKDEGFSPDLPDMDATRACLDMARWFSEHYFSTKIKGGENVPRDGHAMIVGNHSAGLMPIDAMFAMNDVRDRFGEERIVHALVHDFAYVSPTMARNAKKLGILRANKENARAAFEHERLVLVYPGGDLDAFRTFSERKKVVLAGRKGFIKLALDMRVPIVPLVSVGLHESFLVISKGRRLAEMLGLKKLMRTEVMPFGLSFPWGLSPSFFPFLPLPCSVEMEFGERIIPEGDPNDEYAVDGLYMKIENTMQGIMDALNKNRIPLFGR